VGGTPDFRALYSGNYTEEILCVWGFDLMQLNGEDLPSICGSIGTSGINMRPDPVASECVC
jgi:hypothetical protein